MTDAGGGDEHQRLTIADRHAFLQAEALASVVIHSASEFGIHLDRDEVMPWAIAAVRWPDGTEPPTPIRIVL